MSKVSLAFDQNYAPNRNHAPRASHVGPRWFEILASGAAVAGRAPGCAETARLFDWEDATIELADSAATAVEQVVELVEDHDRLTRISRGNLRNMNQKHDWRHRLLQIFNDCQVAIPAALETQLEELRRRAQAVPC